MQSVIKLVRKKEKWLAFKFTHDNWNKHELWPEWIKEIVLEKSWSLYKNRLIKISEKKIMPIYANYWVLKSKIGNTIKVFYDESFKRLFEE